MELEMNENIRYRDTCVAFGHFNAIHKGNKEVIKKVIEQENTGFTSLLLSFEKKPNRQLENKNTIYTETEKIEVLDGIVPQVMVSKQFSDEIEDMTPESFIKEILVEQLGMKVVVVGENIRFGKDRKGTIEDIKNSGKIYGYEVITVEDVKWNNESISTDRISNAILEGELEDANNMLGHKYKMIGKVVHGKAIGRTVGMPTANLQVSDNKIFPRSGVYATLCKIDDQWFQGLTNIGKRPSVDDEDRITIETFLLDFAENIYGKDISLDIHSFVRGVKKMNSIEEVKSQVDKDIKSIRSRLSTIQD